MTLGDYLDRYDRRDWQSADEDAGPVRFALVGLGWWARDVALPAIEASTFCETTVLVSSSREKAERVAAGTDIEHAITYEQFHEGVGTDAYDAVYVGTPNALHLDYAQTAAKYGKGIVSEKPLEATVERGRQMVETAQEAGVQLMTGYRMQVEPAVRRARELIASGAIGDPVQAYGNFTQPLLEVIPNPDQWRLDPDLGGYGVSVMDIGIYPINTARYLLDADPVEARARMRSRHEAFSEVPDEHATIELTFENGLPLVVTTSQNAQSDTQLKIVGTDGMVELLPAFQGTATLCVARGEIRAEITTEFDEHRETQAMFDYFADRLLTGSPVGPDGRDGLTDLRTIRAIHESADTGEAVEIPAGES